MKTNDYQFDTINLLAMKIAFHRKKSALTNKELKQKN